MGAVRNLVDELRRRGVTVHEWPGWDGRGNEGIGQIDPKGAVLHHTASGYGSAFEALVSGRPDLRGTLCNFAGNSNGSLTVVASGLTWHAGTGAGPSLGPLYSYRGWMNRWTVGLEIVYPGDQPMTAAQRATALVFARAVADLFGGGDIECVRAHAETNGRGGDGKWDPGYAPGQTIDMAAFRREAAAATDMEDDMSWTEDLTLTYPDGRTETHQAREWFVQMARRLAAVERQVTPDPTWKWSGPTLANATFSTGMAVGADRGKDLVAEVDEIGHVVLTPEAATALGKAITSNLDRLSDDEVARLATAVQDEADRRDRVRLGGEDDN